MIKKFFHYNLARPFYELIRPLQPIFNLKKRTFFDKFKVRLRHGNQFFLYNNAFYWETEIFWQGYDKINWERKTREIWESLCHSSDIIFDIGANTGIFSMIAKASNSKSVVFAFEPQPNIFKVLEKNNSINHFDVHCMPIALSDQNGELPFYNTGNTTFDSLNTTHGSLNKEWRTRDQVSIMVKVVRLRDFLCENKIERIDLLKLDVETLEYEVLKGYGDLLLDHRPIIVSEVQNKEIGEKISRLFDSKEYFFYWVNEDKGLFPVKSLGKNNAQGHLNYLICPEERKSLLHNFLIDV